jgi:hypothetical protein
MPILPTFQSYETGHTLQYKQIMPGETMLWHDCTQDLGKLVIARCFPYDFGGQVQFGYAQEGEFDEYGNSVGIVQIDIDESEPKITIVGLYKVEIELVDARGEEGKLILQHEVGSGYKITDN